LTTKIAKLHRSSLEENKKKNRTQNVDDATLKWKGLQTNDLLYFPDQLTGAGEFEGCRFVGERIDRGFLLLSAGIESPIFPAQLIASIETISKLRLFYEELFETVLKKQHMSLTDLFGGQDVVEEFWTRPDTSNGGQTSSEEDTTDDSIPWLSRSPCVNALGWQRWKLVDQMRRNFVK
jgi:hypothetical protein